jgi:hypothetical protein
LLEVFKTIFMDPSTQQPASSAPILAGAQAAASSAPPAGLQAALELILQGCEAIRQHSPGLSEEATRLRPALVLLQHAAGIISSVPECGQSATLRWRIYQLIQAQQGSEDSAFYKELRCPIHLGLCGENSDPVTLLCGHSFCLTCIVPVISGTSAAQRRCPQCRAPILVTADQLSTNVAIKAIVDRLLPQAPAGATAGASAGGGSIGGH